MKKGWIGKLFPFGLVTVVLGVLGYILVLPMAIHEFKLWKFSQSLDALSHPADTARVQKYSQVGLLFGNGNHTDFWIREIRSFKGDFPSIQKQYESQKVLFPHGMPISPEVSLLANDSGDVPYDIQQSPSWKECLQASASLYVITVCFQTGPEGDIRSH